MEYNLEERTKTFSKNLLRFFKKIRINTINDNVTKQVLRSSTSVEVNYCEANGATSKLDFRSKIFICKKEAKETLYWIDLFEEIVDEINKKELLFLKDEAKQIMLIFSKIGATLSN